jgi:hypothetical protein
MRSNPGDERDARIALAVQKQSIPMVQYTLPQKPEVVITVRGKDSTRAREKAMDRLMELMEADELGTELAEGFSPSQFVEVQDLESVPEEDAVLQAVQVLSNLVTLKLKVQESRAEALKMRELVELLFSDADVDEEKLDQLKEGFRILKSFAQANLRYRDAREKAQQARIVLDHALQSPEESPNLAEASPKPDPIPPNS